MFNIVSYYALSLKSYNNATYNKITFTFFSDAASATTLPNVSTISSSERKGSPLNLGSRAEAEQSVLSRS